MGQSICLCMFGKKQQREAAVQLIICFKLCLGKIKKELQNLFLLLKTVKIICENNLLTCSCVMEMVGKLFILSLSAGGGPVFSNWFNNFKAEKKDALQLRTERKICMKVLFLLIPGNQP